MVGLRTNPNFESKIITGHKEQKSSGSLNPGHCYFHHLQFQLKLNA